MIANPNLKPEIFKTLELILEHRFDEHLSSELNVFHTDMTNLIEYVEVEKGILQHRNSSNVESIGMEAQLEGKWANGWQGRLSYSWQNSVEQHSQQAISNSPAHMVKLNFIAPLWLDKLFIGFENHYMSNRTTPHNKGKVNDYVVSNLTVFSQNLALKGLELSGSVYNLFDQRYFDPAALEYQQNAIQQDGLTFRIKASLDF